MNVPKLEEGAIYRVDLDGDGLWNGVFTSKLMKVVEHKRTDRDEIFYTLIFENGVTMSQSWSCGFTKEGP